MSNKKIDPAISNSTLPWEEGNDIPNAVRYPVIPQRKKLPNRFDEEAVSMNLEQRNPTADQVRRRLFWREDLNYNCLPRGQNVVVFSTYGPDERFDFKTTDGKMGFWFWGAFPDYPTAESHMAWIQQINPYAAFFGKHGELMGHAIDFPPTSDGNTKQHHVNKEHEDIMRKHLAKAIQEAEFVENRKSSAETQTNSYNSKVDQFNKKIKESLSAIAEHQMTGSDKSELDKTLEMYETAQIEDLETQNIAVVGSNTQHDADYDSSPIRDSLKDVKYITPYLLPSYLDMIRSSEFQLPSTHRYVLKKIQRDDGEWVLVKFTQKRVQ